MTQYLRCACPDPDPQPLAGSKTTLCGQCGGWFSVSIFEMEDWTTFRRTYRDEPAKPRAPDDDE